MLAQKPIRSATAGGTSVERGQSNQRSYSGISRASAGAGKEYFVLNQPRDATATGLRECTRDFVSDFRASQSQGIVFQGAIR
jgi:hypothetical protein